jgi:hypothetical protein
MSEGWHKDKSTYVVVSQREQQQCRENEILIEKNRRDAYGKERHISYDLNISLSSWIETHEDEAGGSIKVCKTQQLCIMRE